MNAFDIYKKYYSLNGEEFKLIEKIPQIIEENLEVFITPVLSFYESEKDLKYFFKNETNVLQFKDNFKKWITRLFTPPFDKSYAEFIKRIGIAHANNNVNKTYSICMQ